MCTAVQTYGGQLSVGICLPPACTAQTQRVATLESKLADNRARTLQAKTMVEFAIGRVDAAQEVLDECANLLQGVDDPMFGTWSSLNGNASDMKATLIALLPQVADAYNKLNLAWYEIDYYGAFYAARGECDMADTYLNLGNATIDSITLPVVDPRDLPSDQAFADLERGASALLQALNERVPQQ